MTGARKIMQLDGRFGMHRGGYLESPVLAYETWGKLSAARDNAILVFSGLSPSAHAASSPEDPSAGWWEDMIGSGQALDTDRYFIICVNSLGSCYGSTGPASINPETGKPYGMSFPIVTIRDFVETQKALLDELG
ncbi:MAG: alpha/beta fold hydrolase, partial [Woeseiaceae bacterium]|nr:alpha/beta fold hydrolase [Woeseiaceae bacterium]